VIAELGLDLRVAVVTGDDLLDRVEDFRAAGVAELYSGLAMPATFLSVNAYLGAFPIAEALGKGADIVITGRGVDSAVSVGSCIHEFGWGVEDYDALAGASLAGHIIECGAQGCGGLFTDWEVCEDWANMGYPIVEVCDDGSFVVGKPDGTDGVVSPASVAEQLVYEIGDPQAYILPDVVCYFSAVEMTQIREQKVRVTGTKGSKPTDTVKVSATYSDGYRAVCEVTVRGIDADGKARKTCDAVLRRTQRMLRERGMADFTETHMSFLGAESDYGANARVANAREVLGRLAAKHADPEALALLRREITSTATSMSPGTIGYGGLAKPSPVVRLFSFLAEKAGVTGTVHFEGERWEVPFTGGAAIDTDAIERPVVVGEVPDGERVEVPLVRIAHGRSGDKGADANIGIIARHPALYAVIREQLTTEVVAEYFGHFLEGVVERWDLPGIHAANFLLHDVLGGGGMASLRHDFQGKAYAQMLLDYPVHVPKKLLDAYGMAR
jgi:hypothetical protein